MDLTTVFIVPNAHHIFGSRHRFSEFVVPSGIHFGGCWVAFVCFLKSFASSGGVRGGNPFLTPFWVNFLGFSQSRENEPVRADGLARESLYLNPWILEDMSTCRYIGRSLCRYVDISV